MKIPVCFLLLLVLLLPASLSAQDSTARFPQAWEGIWEGDLEIYSPRGPQQSVPMELHILPQDSCYSWKMVYAGQARDYRLCPLDPEQGRYEIDEQNSIRMSATLVNGKLFSRFEVMGKLLLSTTELSDGYLEYEIIAGSMQPAGTTGGEIVEGADIPEVTSYPVRSRQVARLKRRE